MRWSTHDLIVAPATVPGSAARAIVRLAGDGLDALLARLFDAEGAGFAAGRGPRAVSARLAGDDLGAVWGAVPVEVLHWPGPGGPVGGPLAEVQLPCSAMLVDAVVAEACRLGARLARGGEFTLRACLAGRLDLVQAEAVPDVVDARSPEDLAEALDRLAGGAGRRLRQVRDRLLDLLADIEAALDFADETTPDSVPVADSASRRSVATALGACAAELDAVAAHLTARDSGAGGDLPRVVLVGRPNVGKSSLFNALVGRDAAIVADEAGTTRDRLESRLHAAGRDGDLPACVLVDLAGLPDEATGGTTATAGTDPDAAAVSTARIEIGRADLLVVCRDAAEPAPPPAGEPSRARLDVITRCDRVPGATAAGVIRTSSTTAEGIAMLRARILESVGRMPGRGSPATLRMAAGVASARRAIASARRDDGDESIVAAHVRAAVEALGEATGVAADAEVLDRIFSRHCIGK